MWRFFKIKEKKKKIIKNEVALGLNRPCCTLLFNIFIFFMDYLVILGHSWSISNFEDVWKKYMCDELVQISKNTKNATITMALRYDNFLQRNSVFGSHECHVYGKSIANLNLNAFICIFSSTIFTYQTKTFHTIWSCEIEQIIINIMCVQENFSTKICLKQKTEKLFRKSLIIGSSKEW